MPATPTVTQGRMGVQLQNNDVEQIEAENFVQARFPRRVSVCAYVCAYVCTCVRMCESVCAYVCACVRMYVAVSTLPTQGEICRQPGGDGRVHDLGSRWLRAPIGACSIRAFVDL